MGFYLFSLSVTIINYTVLKDIINQIEVTIAFLSDEFENIRCGLKENKRFL